MVILMMMLMTERCIAGAVSSVMPVSADWSAAVGPLSGT